MPTMKVSSPRFNIKLQKFKTHREHVNQEGEKELTENTLVQTFSECQSQYEHSCGIEFLRLPKKIDYNMQGSST